MEEKKHAVSELMKETLEKVRLMADANTVVGQPIVTGEVTLIPISRVSVGVGVGGSDFVSKNQKTDSGSCFGGGSGAGMNIDPIAFLVVRGDSVRILPMLPPADGAVGRVVDMVPELVDKVTDFVEKQQAKKAQETQGDSETF